MANPTIKEIWEYANRTLTTQENCIKLNDVIEPIDSNCAHVSNFSHKSHKPYKPNNSTPVGPLTIRQILILIYLRLERNKNTPKI